MPVPPAKDAAQNAAQNAAQSAERFERVLAAFRTMQLRGRFPGGQIAVHHRGVLVLNEAVGDAWAPADFERARWHDVATRSKRGASASRDQERAATPGTLFCAWSASKPLLAMTIARLEEHGELDVRAPIAEILPEFGANGKELVTTLDVLTHRSGVVVPELGQARDDWDDWKKGLARVFAAKPRYPRGTTIYLPYEFGWILAAVVEAVRGRALPDVFADEIATPADLSPLRFSVSPEQAREVARTYLLGKRPVVVSGVRFDGGFEEAANTTMLSSFVPGGSLVTTAAALSGFYATLVGGGIAPNGRRVLDAATVATYTRPHAAGWDPLNRLPFSFGRGFLVGGLGPSIFGPWRSSGCYGHGGALCAFAFADPSKDLAAAILTNGNWTIPEFVLRFGRLVHALRASVSSGPFRESRDSA